MPRLLSTNFNLSSLLPFSLTLFFTSQMLRTVLYCLQHVHVHMHIHILVMYMHVTSHLQNRLVVQCFIIAMLYCRASILIVLVVVVYTGTRFLNSLAHMPPLPRSQAFTRKPTHTCTHACFYIYFLHGKLQLLHNRKCFPS